MLRRHLTPAIVAFSFMLAGCLLGRPAGPAMLVVLFFAASATGIVLARASHDALRRSGILLLSAAVGCLLGLWSAQRMSREAGLASLPFAAKEITGFSGALVSDSSLSSQGDTILRVSLSDAVSRSLGAQARARGTVLVRVRGDYRFAAGQRVAFAGQIAPLDSLSGESFIASVDRKDLVRRGYSSGFWSLRADARDWLHRAIARVGYPASALMEALLIGAREDVPADLSEGFRRTGSLHILALSGLHVSVIYALLLAVLAFMRGTLLKLVIASVVLLFYQVLAGFMPSLLRATIMIMIGGAGLILDRDAEPLNLLGLAGIVELLASPFDAFSLSFQLSYLALAGILVIGPIVHRAFASRLPKVLLTALAMSVGAQIATFPMVAARFGMYYPSGLLAGLILVPLTTAMLWGGLAWTVIFNIPWPALHDMCAQAFSILYRVIDGTTALFARLPGVSVSPQAVPWSVGLSIVLLAGLALLLPIPRRALRRAGVAAR